MKVRTFKFLDEARAEMRQYLKDRDEARGFAHSRPRPKKEAFWDTSVERAQWVEVWKWRDMQVTIRDPDPYTYEMAIHEEQPEELEALAHEVKGMMR